MNLKFHAMQDDRSGNVTLIVCRVSKEAADEAASRAERERKVRGIDPPLITWVETAGNCGHS